LELHAENDMPPEDRQAINRQITEELNVSLGFNLTDAVCGFKAYRVDALSAFEFDVNGYEFPLQLWVQAAAQRLRVEEVPVRLIYNDPSRTFGGPLDDPQERIDHYRAVLCRELGRFAAQLPRATERVPC
jgi:dolichol-phosphate mannosyltransferase